MMPISLHIFLSLFLVLAYCLMMQVRDASCNELLPTVADNRNQFTCPILSASSGKNVLVVNVEQLVKSVNSAEPNTTILLANGRYNLNGACLIVKTPNLTLRSLSGNRDAVLLDGNYKSGEILQIAASDVTIADITISRAYNHSIHVYATSSSDTKNTKIYNVRIVDPGQQAIKINPVSKSYFTDTGEIACSRLELTDSGRKRVRDNCYTGGIDAHRAGEWIVRDNLIVGFWCEKGISEHAIHFWGSSNNTIVERNRLINNARGIGFGMSTSGTSRVPLRNTCSPSVDYIDHYGGMIRNNFISAHSPELFNSEYGFDSGISLWQACNPKVLNNTVYSMEPLKTFSSIEWRFPVTKGVVMNNLTNVRMMERDGAKATKSGNIDQAKSSWFMDVTKGNFHLSHVARTIANRVNSSMDVLDDIDGDFRINEKSTFPGADEPHFSADVH